MKPPCSADFQTDPSPWGLRKRGERPRDIPSSPASTKPDEARWRGRWFPPLSFFPRAFKPPNSPIPRNSQQRNGTFFTIRLSTEALAVGGRYRRPRKNRPHQHPASLPSFHGHGRGKPPPSSGVSAHRRKIHHRVGHSAKSHRQGRFPQQSPYRRLPWWPRCTGDRIMADYHRQFPVYGFDRHKGYPTKAHSGGRRATRLLPPSTEKPSGASRSMSET